MRNNFPAERSFSLVVWLSLLGKRPETLLSVFSVHDSLVVKSLNLQPRSKVHFWPPVYCLLCVLYAQRSVGKHFINKTKSPLFCLFVALLHVVYNLVFQSLLPTDLSCCENQFFSNRCTYDSGECLRSSSTWNQAPVCLR